MIPGEKAKLLNALDHVLGDLEPLYTIELVLAKSPLRGVKSGAIAVFKRNIVNFDPQAINNPAVQRAMEEEIERKTEVMYQDPIYFKESDGQWLDWAMTEVMRIFRKQINSNAMVKVKAPQLRIKVSVSRHALLHEGIPAGLDSVVRDINGLLDNDYHWDPWTRTIRRGRIGAEFKR